MARQGVDSLLRSANLDDRAGFWSVYLPERLLETMVSGEPQDADVSILCSAGDPIQQSNSSYRWPSPSPRSQVSPCGGPIARHRIILATTRETCATSFGFRS